MRPVRDAAGLTRALLALTARGGDYRVRVASGPRGAELVIVGGKLRGVSGVEGESLGDTLLRHGVLDLAVHARALDEWDPRERVGAWLVRIGAAEAAAVHSALELQTIARLATLLRWPTPTYGVAALGEGLSDHLAPPVSLGLSCWLALRGAIEDQVRDEVSAFAATTLTAFGRRLRRELTEHGLDTACWDAALQADPSQGATRRTLEALGAVRDVRAPRGDAHGLLLRKYRELGRRAPAHVLLDVPLTASPAEARRAFRRLVGQLHPDRFGLDEPAISRRASEVVAALSEAVRGFTTVASAARCAVR